jgi:hypothetical protein
MRRNIGSLISDAFVEDEVDEARFGTKVERGTKVVKHIANVFVEQAQCPDSDGDEQQRLKTLVGSDQDQEFIVMLPLLVQSSRGFNHVCRRFGACTSRSPHLTSAFA